MSKHPMLNLIDRLGPPQLPRPAPLNGSRENAIHRAIQAMGPYSLGWPADKKHTSMRERTLGALGQEAMSPPTVLSDWPTGAVVLVFLAGLAVFAAVLQ